MSTDFAAKSLRLHLIEEHGVDANTAANSPVYQLWQRHLDAHADSAELAGQTGVTPTSGDLPEGEYGRLGVTQAHLDAHAAMTPPAPSRNVNLDYVMGWLRGAGFEAASAALAERAEDILAETAALETFLSTPSSTDRG